MNDCFELIDKQEEFLIINKYANVNFHDEGNIGSGLFSKIKEELSITDLYPVHRLDKLTSGLMIFARTAESAKLFQQLFSHHQVEKYYIAISDCKPKKKQGLIKGDMTKSRRGMWKLLRSQNNPAITQFHSYSLAPSIRGFLLKPHSGKTHQIRVALASIGAPILGDELYGKSKSDRGYLHAYALRFTLNDRLFDYSLAPNQGARFTDELCQHWLSSITKPWQHPWPKI
ncbi:TIGR01621 family pseudouridine synthase [Thalassotalea sp. M1531]|uniref:TIGR01621 family pseudouridine synthase n=1 Tax=Thalassotalea algicola TaxID=2716224 RepID=A0A7Y0Q697_9GAMM|nr:TIGR01621 family pseudouridine synthase [Thalassotalea algicola]NMP30951.1 TIGR01621 family pseudouridine synthase [Thalassotalea algicola]